MPTLQGTRPDSARAGQVILFTSELTLSSRRHTMSFMIGAIRLGRVLAGMLDDPTSGLLRYELIARPWANRYDTSSVWTSPEAIQRFVEHPVHAAIMRRHGPHLGPASFRTETVDAADLPIT
jgi:heme-degrading monooxygenase HmoA